MKDVSKLVEALELVKEWRDEYLTSLDEDEDLGTQSSIDSLSYIISCNKSAT